MTDTPLIAAVRPLSPNGHFTQTEVDHLTAVERSFAARAPAPVVPPQAAPTPLPPAAAGDPLTPRVAMEVITHEAIVQEAYLDSGNVWTWSAGVTNASGHEVYPRYKDNPQTMAHCLEVYIWLLRTGYLPDVLKEFAGYPLSEAQLAAALSFHWNTGHIQSTSWTDLVKAGRTKEARLFLENHYLNGTLLVGRRKAEAALFFDGHWSQDGKAMIYPVSKPSYHPNFHGGHREDISADLAAAVAGGRA